MTIESVSPHPKQRVPLKSDPVTHHSHDSGIADVEVIRRLRTVDPNPLHVYDGENPYFSELQ